MNQLARDLGYTGHKEKRSLVDMQKEEQQEAFKTAKEYIVNALGKTAAEKKKVEDTIKYFENKYSEQLETGEYSLLTTEMLLAIGEGMIVDENNGVLVYTREKYIGFEDMTAIK